MLLQLAFEPFEQREGVRGRAGKPADHRPVAEPPHLARIGFHDRLAHRDLAVADHDDLAAAPDRKDGGAVPDRHGVGIICTHDRDVGCAFDHATVRCIHPLHDPLTLPLDFPVSFPVTFPLYVILTKVRTQSPERHARGPEDSTAHRRFPHSRAAVYPRYPVPKSA
ncbi:hypothetical protein SPHINGOT1_240001 [Sphingomonas sp. T1]|nr:hypothetical protein SPHINGOT1_240001 [Sphingomonas sp. T1]